MALVITGKAGIVHESPSHCPSVKVADKIHAITPLQAFVYKLPGCGICWPNVQTYERRIGITAPKVAP